MAAARALMLAPRPAAAAGLLLHCPAQGDATAPVTLVAGDPLGQGAVVDLARPEALLHVHGGVTRDLRADMRPVLFHGAYNTAMAWQVVPDLSAPGRHVLMATSATRRDPATRNRVQQITVTIVQNGPSAEGVPCPLGLAAEIVPDRDMTEFSPGALFSGRVLAGGHPVAGTVVHLERMATELTVTGDGLLPPAPGTKPLWALCETDPEGRFRSSLLEPGLWAITAPGVGIRRGWPRPRQDAVLWLRVGTGGSCRDDTGGVPARRSLEPASGKQVVVSRSWWKFEGGVITG